MHKEYPYLQDSYIYQTDIEWEKRNILKDIDNFLNQRQYIKIILLDWDEDPIKEIEGEISSGSISKNGDSPIRRTAQLTCAVDANSYSVDDGKADFAINKKVFIEIGVKNETDYYPDYPIFWFPEGVFFIGSFSVNAGSAASTVITLSLKDKMAMLNGDVGGTLPATVIFDSMDTQLPTGEYIEQKVLIYNIIQEAVHHYGGEDLNRIVIEGVPRRIRRIMQWTGDTPLYQKTTPENSIENDETTNELSGNYYEFTTNIEEVGSSYITYEKGDDVGYIMDDFVMVDELTGAPGETVTSILDKIKSAIGNYEYFYDVFGVFHFKEIKNYYVTTQARTLLDEMAENDYLVEVNNSRSVYTFDDEKLLTSISVAPQYENIKNDYIIEGKTTVGDNAVYPIRYHLVIDDKPKSLGVDKRPTIRKRIDNTKLIEEKSEELKNYLVGYNNSSKSLEDLLYKIRNAKTYIKNKQTLIDTKDKELLKYLQDYNDTAFTYADLEKQKETIGDKLLSEIFLIMIKAKKTNILEYVDSLKDESVEELKKDAAQINKILQKTKKQQEVLENFVNKMQQGTLSQEDIITNIYKADTLNFLTNNQIYFNTRRSLRYIDNAIESLEAELQQAQDKYNFSNDRFEAFKNAIKDLYIYIQDLKSQIQEREAKLFGFTVNNSEPINDWQANDYEFIVSKSIPLIFSHNIEQITEWELTKTDTYKFKTSDGLSVTKTILPKNNKDFYSNGYLGEFLNLWLSYHNAEDENSELYKINELQKEIDDLINQNGKYQNPSPENPNKDKRKYYGIYPTDVINNNDIQEMIFYKHPRNNTTCAAYVKKVTELPEIGNFNLIYKEGDESQVYYYWDGQMYKKVEILECYDNQKEENLYYAYDWRTKLYLDGLKGVINGTDQGYYFAELSAFWPQVYDLVEQKFFGEKEDATTHIKTLASTGTYFLDFLDATCSSFGEWSVKNIGRRSDVIVKDEINCLFQPEIPNVILLPANTVDLNTMGQSSVDKIYRYGSALESQMSLAELKLEAKTNFYPWTQVSSEIFSKLLTGGYKNGAFDQIKYELYLHTHYQKSVSLTSIPVFYLEPNSRITVNDTTTNTYGDFVVQSINLTLGPGANMSISCNEIMERF